MGKLGTTDWHREKTAASAKPLYAASSDGTTCALPCAAKANAAAPTAAAHINARLDVV
eukprot:CAMPEP_0184435752 /NCGR_PEP_ID=MMETSP0738-20130409/507708_1 /TAXON_ID=385413 /ORGANISM="Thalassiosira miniscula, Strain CCMP1093" /LENGTH=57 /DNA_ID=CAMNT_0026802269 /DNA_START=383 /DNA_END=555 /DNA_ORIENTATION=-